MGVHSAELSTPESERRQRVTALELFFDLVVVFAITQVTSFISETPTWGGLVQGLLVLAALWWAWASYAWLTNTLDPEEGGVRLAVFGAMAAMLIVSLAVPDAFGADGVTFGVAYLVVRVLHLVLYAIAGRGDPDLFRAVMRIVPTSVFGPILLVIAGFLDGSAQLIMWSAALAIDYLGVLVGHMEGWRLSPEHFVERHGLVIIIALGESIFAIGIGAAGIPLDTGVIVAALMGILVAAAVWSYFDWFAYAIQARLAELNGARRAALARDAYSYLHLPMVAGIVLFALGLKTTLAHVEEPLGTIPSVGLFGGVGLYFLAHVALRLRMGGGWGRGRPIATVVLMVSLVALVCVLLITYEALAHRESRAFMRERRGAFTIDEVSVYAERERRVFRHR